MTILEQSLVPKNPARKSEDGIIVTDDFIAVIDGSTSKSRHRYSRLNSNGRLAMLIAEKVIRHAPKDVTMRQLCSRLTAAIRKEYVSLFSNHIAHLADHPEDRLCASAIVYSRLRREIWMIGDCQCLVNGELFENPKPYETLLAEMRAKEVRRLLATGTTTEELLANDAARPIIIPHMLEAMKQQNVSYAVIDGFPIPTDKVRVFTLDFQPWEIVFASDGYPFLCPTLEESEARLATQHAEDPLNIGTFKATKAFIKGNNSFDDRAYIRFRV